MVVLCVHAAVDTMGVQCKSICKALSWCASDHHPIEASEVDYSGDWPRCNTARGALTRECQPLHTREACDIHEALQ